MLPSLASVLAVLVSPLIRIDIGIGSSNALVHTYPKVINTGPIGFASRKCFVDLGRSVLKN